MATERDVLEIAISTSASVIDNTAFVLHDMNTGDPVRIKASQFLRNEEVLSETEYESLARKEDKFYFCYEDE
jgi:hypothetical protein